MNSVLKSKFSFLSYILLITFFLNIITNISVVAAVNPDFYTVSVNVKGSIPDFIDSERIYDKSNEIYKLDRNIIISAKGKLSFKNNSIVQIDRVSIQNSNTNNIDGILIQSSSLAGVDANIFSTVTLEDSKLTFSKGKINKLVIKNKTDVAAKETNFDDLEFKELANETEQDNFKVGLEKVTVKELNINLDKYNNVTQEYNHLNNKVTRKANFKDSNFDQINLKGYIDVLNDEFNKEELKTNFNFEAGKIKSIVYIDDKLLSRITLPEQSVAGFFNFKDNEIENMNVSINLLRGITLNGATINNLTLENTDLEEIEKKVTNTSFKPDDPNKPIPPTYSNLQLIGLGTSYIKNLDLNGVRQFNIQGEIAASSYNAPLSSIYIENLKGYQNTNFSLYHLKDVYFGIARPKKEDPEDKPDKPKVKNSKENKIPGGENDTININYLYRVTALGIHNNTVKFDWNIEKNSKYGYDQYLSIYNLSQLQLVNSLVDISKTVDLKMEIKNINSDQQIDPDPRKFNTIYDYNITYEGNMSTFGTIFHFENSGAIKNNNRKSYVPLRIRVKGSSFVTAKDMLSDLDMQLNGERNMFVLESNKHNRNYTFHTNYNYNYLKSKDGQHKPGAPALRYNYWDYNESVRVEQNWYTLKTDLLIVDRNSKEYEQYKKNHSNELLEGESDFATAWFTYWQPYQVDKEGNPKIDNEKNINKEDQKYEFGDQLAWDQKTDGRGRGGFPVEFGNKIQVENAKVTFLKPLDNLTVLEVVGKDGWVNFQDMNKKYVSTKDSQWLTILRMRSGILGLAQAPMYVDKLQVYSHKFSNEATFRTQYQVTEGSDINEVLNQQKLVVNKEVDFHENLLKMDLYFSDYFINLNHKVTLNILELGEYKEKVKEKEGEEEIEKEVIKKAQLKNFKDVVFDQGIMFRTNYYWKDNNLFVEITREKDFKNFITNSDKAISDIFDTIVNNYSVSVDKNNKVQFLDVANNPQLNQHTVRIINELFKSKDIHELKNAFLSLRPINNEVIFNLTNKNTKILFNAVKNANNYRTADAKGKLVPWSIVSDSNYVINNTANIVGTTVNNKTFTVGAHSNFNNVALGAFLGYVYSKYDSAYFNGNAPWYGVGIYSDINLKQDYFIKLASLYAMTDINGERSHYFMDEKAKLRLMGQSIDLMITVGKTYNLKKNGFLTSFIGINSGYSNFDGYKESGGSATLDVKAFSAPYAFTSLGIEYGKDIPISDVGILVPKVGLIYEFRYYSLEDTIAKLSKINGIDPSINNIRYSSNNYGKNSIVFNLGINYILSKSSTISSNFDAEIINKDIKGFNIFFGYKHSF